jgi:hypothetical protein
MLLHFTRDGEAFGPYPLEEARGYLKKGQILPTDQAWYEGAPGWMNVTEVPGVIGTAAPGAPPPPPPAVAPVQTEVVARYTSDTTKFNKRFFDTEIGRFQKLNPDGNPEQLFMQTREGAFAVFRISEVKGDHCFISIDVGGARKEKRVNYFNINEIEIQRR